MRTIPKSYPVMKAISNLVQGTKEDREQKLIQSSTPPDPGYNWDSKKLTIRHHKREQRFQPFPSR